MLLDRIEAETKAKADAEAKAKAEEQKRLRYFPRALGDEAAPRNREIHRILRVKGAVHKQN